MRIWQYSSGKDIAVQLERGYDSVARAAARKVNASIEYCVQYSTPHALLRLSEACSMSQNGSRPCRSCQLRWACGFEPEYSAEGHDDDDLRTTAALYYDDDDCKQISTAYDVDDDSLANATYIMSAAIQPAGGNGDQTYLKRTNIRFFYYSKLSILIGHKDLAADAARIDARVQRLSRQAISNEAANVERKRETDLLGLYTTKGRNESMREAVENASTDMSWLDSVNKWEQSLAGLVDNPLLEAKVKEAGDLISRVKELETRLDAVTLAENLTANDLEKEKETQKAVIANHKLDIDRMQECCRAEVLAAKETAEIQHKQEWDKAEAQYRSEIFSIGRRCWPYGTMQLRSWRSSRRISSW